MKISSICKNNNITFNSRNSEIRYADKIARNINQKFPMLSATRYADFDSAYFFKNSIKELSREINLIRKDTEPLYSLYQNIEMFVGSVLDLKKGNCGEFAELATLSARCNGIQDSYVANLMDINDKDFDHSVCLVKNGDRPYVIDAWLNFADYVPNAFLRYQKEFSKHFEFKNNEKLTIEICDDYINQINEDRNISFIRNVYPEFVVKRD